MDKQSAQELQDLRKKVRMLESLVANLETTVLTLLPSENPSPFGPESRQHFFLVCNRIREEYSQQF